MDIYVALNIFFNMFVDTKAAALPPEPRPIAPTGIPCQPTDGDTDTFVQNAK